MTSLATFSAILADLPLGLVVGGPLVMFAAEEGPFGDVAGARLVTTKVVGDDLARSDSATLCSNHSSFTRLPSSICSFSPSLVPTYGR